MWKPVPDFHYEVSDEGEVRNTETGKILSLSARDRYLLATLSRDGKPYTFTVHSLVLLAHVGPRPVGACIRHLDGDVTNNSLNNLAYGTHSENMLDKRKTGTCRTSHVLSDRQVRVIRGLHKLGYSANRTQEIIGCSIRTIYSVRGGYTYTHVE